MLLETGFADLSYNVKRNILGAVSIRGVTSYHLFCIDTYNTNPNEIVKLSRRSKWQEKHGNQNRYCLFINQTLIFHDNIHNRE